MSKPETKRNNQNQINTSKKTLFQKSFIVMLMMMKGYYVCITPSRKRNCKRNQLVPTSFNIISFDTMIDTEFINFFEEFSNSFLQTFKSDNSKTTTKTTKVTNINNQRQIAKKAADFKVMETLLDFLKTEKIKIEYSFRKKTRGIGSTPRIKEVFLTQQQSELLCNYFNVTISQNVMNKIQQCHLNESDIDELGECFYHFAIENNINNCLRSNNPMIQTFYPLWDKTVFI